MVKEVNRACEKLNEKLGGFCIAPQPQKENAERGLSVQFRCRRWPGGGGCCVLVQMVRCAGRYRPCQQRCTAPGKGRQKR